MQISTIERLYVPIDDCVSLYVARDTDWAEAEQRLADLGVEPAVRERLRSMANAAVGPDDAGVAAFVWETQPPEAFGLPVPPAGTMAVRQPLAYGAPLLEVAEVAVPHVVVVADDAAADVLAFGTHDVTEPATVRFDDGESRFDGLVATLDSLVRSMSAEILAVSGPAELVPDLLDRARRVLPVSCAIAAIDPDEADLADTVVRLASDRTARSTVEALQMFRFARTHGSTAEGVADTIDALARGVVRRLLVHDDPADLRAAWIAEHPRGIALTEPTETDQSWVNVRLTDACLRSALLSGAEAHSIPGHLGDGPTDGLGVILAQ